LTGKSYYRAIGIDTVATIVNDLVTCGALPISVAMHAAVGDGAWFAQGTRAADLGMPVAFCEGDAQALPFDDGTFDSALSTYSMCSVPDERRAVLEMMRVLKPGGRLILVDHVRSSVVPIYWLQRLMELAPSRGERELTRRPIVHVRAAGLLIEETDRSRAGIIERIVARKP